MVKIQKMMNLASRNLSIKLRDFYCGASRNGEDNQEGVSGLVERSPYD